MSTGENIHVVRAAAPAVPAAAPAVPSTPRDLDPREIVHETFAIMRECSQAFASDDLLVDLVASVIVVRLRKGRQ